MTFKRLSRIAIISAALLLAVLLLGFVAPAKADVAPPEPPHGTNPEPGAEITNVRMMSETVIIEVGDPNDIHNAKVTATFTMQNQGETEEQMDARFPLYWKNNDDCVLDYYSFDPGINDLKVWIDGQTVETRTDSKTYTITDAYGKEHEIKISCWGYFPVTFPPKTDVTIKVTYSFRPFRFDDSNSYTYILGTGGGWADTIGIADIIVKLDYELNEFTYIGCSNDDCTIVGNEIHWHFENFEPPEHYLVETWLMPPELWQDILTEKANITFNPKDGEAWGRLGKAYKEAIIGRRWLRDDPGGVEMYQLSVEAYQKAIELLPNDADWHYGYTELLCHKAELPYYSGDDWITEDWKACLEQLQQTLILDPDHEEANYQLNFIGNWTDVVDLSGSEPIYLMLTPQPTTTETLTPAPTRTPTPILTRTRHPTYPKATLTYTPTQTATPTVAATIAATPVAARITAAPTQQPPISQPAPEQPPARSSVILIAGAIVLVLIVVGAGLAALRKR